MLQMTGVRSTAISVSNHFLDGRSLTCKRTSAFGDFSPESPRRPNTYCIITKRRTKQRERFLRFGLLSWMWLARWWWPYLYTQCMIQKSFFVLYQSLRPQCDAVACWSRRRSPSPFRFLCWCLLVKNNTCPRHELPGASSGGRLQRYDKALPHAHLYCRWNQYADKAFVSPRRAVTAQKLQGAPINATSSSQQQIMSFFDVLKACFYVWSPRIGFLISINVGPSSSRTSWLLRTTRSCVSCCMACEV